MIDVLLPTHSRITEQDRKTKAAEKHRRTPNQTCLSHTPPEDKRNQQARNGSSDE
jgi:hypothetical protein